jgi:hypothetical protein
LILVGGIAWAVIGAAAHPYTPSVDGVRSAFEYPFRALFAADVLKHVLVGAFVFWLAYRKAAQYLQDIFELEDSRVAERFIRQAAFGSSYDLMEIRNGEVAEKDKKSPVYLVGGPGKVRIYLENAALFESVDGRPRMIGPTTLRSGTDLTQPATPTSEGSRSGWVRSVLYQNQRFLGTGGDGVVQLEIFERLRRVVDLRDHVEDMNITGRTRDGILIHAKDLRFIFSIFRDDKSPSLKRPYPFNAGAVEDFIYNSPRLALIPNISSQINRELGSFISNHPLGEFLAAIGWPEVLDDSQDPAPEPDSPPANSTDGETSGAPPPFVPRPEISDLFFDFNKFVARNKKRGVELRWIGIGTWVLPDGIIPERHVQAWRITQANLAQGSRAAINALIRESKQMSLPAILRRTPLETSRQLNLADEAARNQHIAVLIHSYRAVLREAIDIYAKNNQSDTPEARCLTLVYNHLTHQVAHFAGDL